MGLDATSYDVCNSIDMFATELDGSGAGINYFADVEVDGAVGDYTTVTADAPVVFVIPGAKNITVQIDFYVVMNNSVTEVHIEPSSFGGFFYVEAQTLFRREDTGKDMAAELIIPKAKVQSGFTFTMAASGDPSTFDFVMDAFPGYTRFDSTTKKMCVIQIVGVDKPGEAEASAHTHDEADEYDSPAFKLENRTSASAVPANAFTDHPDVQANQEKLTVSKKRTGDIADEITLTIAGGVDSLNDVDVPGTTGWGTDKWVATAYATGKDSIKGLVYFNRGTETVFGDDDVAEAKAAGLPAGTMIVWTKASLAKTTPATFSLRETAGGKDFATVTITAVDGE
jgi:hypothetical protein